MKKEWERNNKIGRKEYTGSQSRYDTMMREERIY